MLKYDITLYNINDIIFCRIKGLLCLLALHFWFNCCCTVLFTIYSHENKASHINVVECLDRKTLTSVSHLVFTVAHIHFFVIFIHKTLNAPIYYTEYIQLL